eukprot:TRINITY_DN3782_c0_g1_i1.p1 TRINITY_DN3782_c0_g1~~TRINITY_DN3782_c0_g1_i1.p1  ORF type:complete len:116 (+),score=27.04 TRINITY_DN3782_c0_g1_i1:227-574(+)
MSLSKKETRADQWKRIRSGGPLELEPEGPVEETHAGGLVVKALWEQLKEQQERQEMLYVETSLVSETGLDTDEFLFLDEHEQRRNALLEQQRREMQDFNISFCIISSFHPALQNG